MLIEHTPNLRELIKNLPKGDHEALFYAFNNGITQTITLEDGYYITVYASANEPFIEKQGTFTLGRRPEFSETKEN